LLALVDVLNAMLFVGTELELPSTAPLAHVFVA